MINVTQSFLPPQQEYQAILKRAWDNAWLTNRGELTKELEGKLKEYLSVNHILLLTNGTLPIQIAIRGLGLTGEIITTPFSYVATTSSIVWEHCTPVFVDIDPDYLTIDETKIEAKITSNTSAIMATHVFGNPCHVEAIEEIAKKHNLKVIYDAAHCFGVRYKGNSIFNYGDVSTCSFHATKLFHTGEGGGLFCNDKELEGHLYYHHNFGHIDPYTFYGLGINAKISELQSAMGLAVFPYMDEIIENRTRSTKLYTKEFENSSIRTLKIREGTTWNAAYYPVILKNEETMLHCLNELQKNNINPRRYFYPSLNTLKYVKYQSMPVSENISKRILCLPLYYDLEPEVVHTISTLLKHIHE
ncbi:DegT/DnrJ/EryC1/StrS family aminotransferase [Gangjinia marincola]|uniref:DegT/DnrJ/EryC1/StrS family aminotransferase n=1 Tax=Gangjinia marincola TaxID=578463 RepID=A0ABP3XQF6_9FLAO